MVGTDEVDRLVEDFSKPTPEQRADIAKVMIAEVVKLREKRMHVTKACLREAFSRRKTAKITFEEFESITGETLSKED
jgi:hypothetical protein